MEVNGGHRHWHNSEHAIFNLTKAPTKGGASDAINNLRSCTMFIFLQWAMEKMKHLNKCWNLVSKNVDSVSFILFWCHLHVREMLWNLCSKNVDSVSFILFWCHLRELWFDSGHYRGLIQQRSCFHGHQADAVPHSAGWNCCGLLIILYRSVNMSTLGTNHSTSGQSANKVSND